MRPEIEVVLIAAGTAAATGLIGLQAVSWLGRRAPRAAAILAPMTPVLAVGAALVVCGRAMFISPHDLTVLAWIVAAAVPLSLAFGLIAARRLDEQTRAAAEAAAELAASQEVERRRREMSSWISHDLRTPLAGMRAMTEALEDGVAPDPARYHRQLRQEVHRLSGMVDDLLALSRLQSDDLRLSFEQIDVGDVVSDTIAATDALAAAHGIRLTGHADGDLRVRADEREISRAITNLVTNGLRHTPQDGAVSVVAHREGAGVVISVTDACGGIPDADMARLFEPGWRGTPARTQATGEGAGLGLAVVQGVAAAHHGEVSVRNVEGGCRFDFRLAGAADSALAADDQIGDQSRPARLV